MTYDQFIDGLLVIFGFLFWLKVKAEDVSIEPRLHDKLLRRDQTPRHRLEFLEQILLFADHPADPISAEASVRPEPGFLKATPGCRILASESVRSKETFGCATSSTEAESLTTVNELDRMILEEMMKLRSIGATALLALLAALSLPAAAETTICTAATTY